MPHITMSVFRKSLCLWVWIFISPHSINNRSQLIILVHNSFQVNGHDERYLESFMGMAYQNLTFDFANSTHKISVISQRPTNTSNLHFHVKLEIEEKWKTRDPGGRWWRPGFDLDVHNKLWPLRIDFLQSQFAGISIGIAWDTFQKNTWFICRKPCFWSWVIVEIKQYLQYHWVHEGCIRDQLSV